MKKVITKFRNCFIVSFNTSISRCNNSFLLNKTYSQAAMVIL